MQPVLRFTRPIFSLLFRWVVPSKVASQLSSAELVHFIYNGLTDAATYSCRIAEKSDIPFVFTPNVLTTEDTPTAWNSKRFKRLYQHSDAIIALTNHEAEYLVRQGADPARLYVVPYGPVLAEKGDANRCRSKLNLNDERIILFLGRVVEQKGYRLLLDAFSTINDSFPDTVLVFMGPVTSEVTGRIEKENNKRIFLIDSPDQQLKADLLMACELLCVPSSIESLGVVYLEAFACARPVVALDLPVLREVISDGKDGLLVAHNVEAVAGAVCKLLENPNDASIMGKNGLSKVTKHYAWNDVVSDVLEIYSHAIARR